MFLWLQSGAASTADMWCVTENWTEQISPLLPVITPNPAPNTQLHFALRTQNGPFFRYGHTRVNIIWIKVLCVFNLELFLKATV